MGGLFDFAEEVELDLLEALPDDGEDLAHYLFVAVAYLAVLLLGSHQLLVLRELVLHLLLLQQVDLPLEQHADLLQHLLHSRRSTHHEALTHVRTYTQLCAVKETHRNLASASFSLILYDFVGDDE